MIEVRLDVVIKRYDSTEHGRPEREWRALELLARYAPGLAPVPVRADLDADPPTVVMSRLGGDAIDFEYAGRSDRAFELAEVTEHISVWRDDPAGMTAVLERLDLTAEEAGRLTECRRLLALYWLLRTRGETQAAQANRMLALL